MGSVNVILLFTFVAQAYAKELLAHRNANSQDFMDKLVDKLVTRASKFWPFPHAVLDETTLAKAQPLSSYGKAYGTLGKPSYLSIPPTRMAKNIPYTSKLAIPYFSASCGIGKHLPRNQVIRPKAEGGVTDSLDFLDALCDVDTGEGCGEDLKTSASVDVEIGQGFEPLPCQFELDSPTNTIEQFSTELPSGIVFEQAENKKIVVAELDEKGQGYASGVRVGDVLRATTCVKIKRGNKEDNESLSGFTYWVAGVGSSGKTKALFTVDGASFAKAMAEIRSNVDADGKVTLVVERVAAATAASSTK